MRLIANVEDFRIPAEKSEEAYCKEEEISLQ
jgi:hypothetical protein